MSVKLGIFCKFDNTFPHFFQHQFYADILYKDKARLKNSARLVIYVCSV